MEDEPTPRDVYDKLGEVDRKVDEVNARVRYLQHLVEVQKRAS
jgi:hypothetical protein